MKNYKQSLFILALSAFCMGVTEFVMAGVLVDVEKYFQVDTKTAGYLTTLYALGIMFGAPLATIPLSRFARHIQLLINLGIFTCANLIIFLSTNFYLSAFARFIAGTQHGVFFVIATLVVSTIAPYEKRTGALAIMVTGLTVALVTGVPLGTFIGHYFGFKFIFLLLCLLTVCAFFGIWYMLPKNLHSNQMSVKNLFLAFQHPNLLKTYIITICACGAQFVLYVYLQKLLVELSGFEVQDTAYILLLYGIFAICGNLWGGKLVDKFGAIVALRLILSIEVAVFLSFLLTQNSKITVLCSIAFMGFFAFSSIPALKALGFIKAKRYSYKVIDSTVSVNEASFNVGIALASFIGGLVLAFFGIELNALFSAFFILPALLFSVLFAKDKFRIQKYKTE
ncbi:MFS transporter [Campylobacter sp. MIT 21-1685]|nr:MULTISPECIES: MFS transporter [unclassified Campylobacter]MCX2682490.1 MFS transporter [Campylobacter sp. MIT 21-1684]MCX2750797.1 MFS transporter [Campylobacter sp. MIT 21-1682]MCX2806971.1 MFS transporter [Campylobacter sp. MIT 21-1685]